MTIKKVILHKYIVKVALQYKKIEKKATSNVFFNKKKL